MCVHHKFFQGLWILVLSILLSYMTAHAQVVITDLYSVQQGNIALTSHASKIKNQYIYSPYGQSHNINKPQTISANTNNNSYSTLFDQTRDPLNIQHNQFGYTGQAQDPSTNLKMLGGFRNYAPGIGQFIQPDTYNSFSKHSISNRYMYTNANPLSQSDPSGHFPYIDFLDTLSFVGGMLDPVGGVGVGLALGSIITPLFQNNALSTPSLASIGINVGINVGIALAGIGTAKLTPYAQDAFMKRFFSDSEEIAAASSDEDKPLQMNFGPPIPTDSFEKTYTVVDNTYYQNAHHLNAVVSQERGRKFLTQLSRPESNDYVSTDVLSEAEADSLVKLMQEEKIDGIRFSSATKSNKNFKISRVRRYMRRKINSELSKQAKDPTSSFQLLEQFYNQNRGRFEATELIPGRGSSERGNNTDTIILQFLTQ